MNDHRMLLRRCRFASAALAVLVFSSTCAYAADATAGRRQVLTNPGFENGAAGWEIPSPAEGNQIAVTADQARNGKGALKLSAAKAGEDMVVTSEWFEVTPDAGLDGEVWIKTADIRAADEQAQGRRSRGGLSVAIEVVGPDKTTNKMTLPIANASGTVGEWTRYQGQTCTSKDCAFARYRISLAGSTGTVWLDDVAANYLPLPTPDPSAVAQPALVPATWLIQRSSETFEFGRTAVIAPKDDTRLRAAVEAYLASIGVEHGFDSAEGAAVILRFTDASDAEVMSKLQSRFAGHELKEVGNEGYFLSVQSAGGRPMVLIAANTEQGRFYGLQTLKQLTADKKLHAVDILDRPTMTRRGIVMSSKRYNAPETIGRMAASKMNTSWSQGSFTNDKFKQKWRQPFTEEELAGLKSFIGRAHANFITPWMAFGPRGDYDHRAEPNRARPHPGEIQYSSDQDIDIIVGKMDQLYSIGLRRFGINFDDLQNYREQTLIGEDLKKWGEGNVAFAKAHAHLMSEIMKRLRARHPGEKLEFMTVPYLYWYPSKGRSSEYLKTFAAGLPEEVEMITCSYTDADILAMHELTGRPTMVWHNYFVEDAKTASHRLTNLEYGTPFVGLYTWTDPAIRNAMSGIIHLMPQDGETPEDKARTSWSTASDWQWSPDRYDPIRSFQAAAARYQAASKQ